MQIQLTVSYKWHLVQSLTFSNKRFKIPSIPKVIHNEYGLVLPPIKALNGFSHPVASVGDFRSLFPAGMARLVPWVARVGDYCNVKVKGSMGWMLIAGVQFVDKGSFPNVKKMLLVKPGAC